MKVACQQGDQQSGPVTFYKLEERNHHGDAHATASNNLQASQIPHLFRKKMLAKYLSCARPDQSNSVDLTSPQ